MASSAVAALMLARERQRIDAQCTHDIFLAKLLELSAAKIDIKSKHIFEFYKTVSSKGNKSQQKCCLPYSLVVSCNMLISVAELSQASSSTAWRIYETREATRCTAITAPVRPDVEFCNDEPAIAIEDEDTLLL